MNKMQIAHDWAMRNNGSFNSFGELAKFAWQYADAMQAEADEREDKTRPEVLEEWQPDWSQAPTNELEELNYWCMDENGDPWWFSVKPKAKYGQWNSKNETGLAIKAPSFNYQGNWQDSLRKRPQ